MTQGMLKNLIAVLLLGCFCVMALAQQTSSTTRYIYDANGRLRAVVTPTGEAAVYDYDPAGNITAIRRLAADALELIGFSPQVGSPLDRVTIYGVGIDNGLTSVSFNGVPARVLSSSPVGIVVEVPTNATTGPITIVTARGSVINRLHDGNSGDGPGGGGGGKTSPDEQTPSPGGGGGYFAKGGNATGGFAPGGGGNRYGSLRLLPLVGGSGGGGSSATLSSSGYGGGGGGGAILLASSGRITFQSGQIDAGGGSGYYFSGVPNLNSGGGAGGAIRVIATTIAGNPFFRVVSGFTGLPGGSGGPGYVRVEAINYENYAPGISPDISVFSAGLPTTVTPANLPQLRITTIAGTNAPATPNGSFFKAPDFILPSSQTSPVAVGLAGTNIPTGTIVKVIVTGETGTPVTVDSGALVGTNAATTGTANVTLAPGYNLINATVSVDVQLLAGNARPLYLEGERIKRIEVGATFNGKSELTFITETGKRIKGE